MAAPISSPSRTRTTTTRPDSVPKSMPMVNVSWIMRNLCENLPAVRMTNAQANGIASRCQEFCENDFASPRLLDTKTPSPLLNHGIPFLGEEGQRNGEWDDDVAQVSIIKRKKTLEEEILP